MTTFSREFPFGQTLPFEWNRTAMEGLIGDHPVLQRHFAMLELNDPPRLSKSEKQKYDGCILLPNYHRISPRDRMEVFVAVIDRMEQVIGQRRCEVFNAVKWPHETLRWADQPYWDANKRDDPFLHAKVQLARRNFGKIDPPEDELPLDPVAALIAVYHLMCFGRSFNPLHIIVPSALYSPQNDGRYTDAVRIDVEQRSSVPNVVCIDWNWRNQNRARPHYNVGTMVIR